ncbi:DUF2855 family protein [Mycobacterium sp. 3519A]|uniref:DUF2855 family protein n=1 Tax=Mycobacterium sp. 3519A TaxID=2057184 RepID=UPI000C7C1C35|nr:DUF2855 family protein [Mycobacterium sp. 3519A]
MILELHRKDLHQTRFLHNDAPTPADGQALLRIESFGLTSNNITYAVFGEAMRYWDFFPASESDWGRLNVWGYAHVEDSRHPDLPTGTRVYGYLPCGDHLLVQPDRVDEKGFVDAAPHRAGLPSVYQGYRNLAADAFYSADHEAAHLVFFPLFFTAFLIDDFLADENFFGADTVVISSASAKTALIAAYLLAKRDGVTTVGLTSAGNKQFVESLDVYDSVMVYDDISALPGERAVYIDISGSGTVRAAVHTRYGDRLGHSAIVGATHWTEMGAGAGELVGPSPVLFFAPDRIVKRGADWGPARLDQSLAEAWQPFAAWSSNWLRVERISSEDDIKRAYLELLDGKVDPASGCIVEV